MSFKILDHDNIYVQVIPDDRGEMREMVEYFCFFVPGYRFHPAFKAKRWDGRVRLLNANTGLIYRGLLYRVLEFCQMNKYQVDVDPGLIPTEQITLEEVEEYTKKLDFHSKGDPIQLRDYQLDAVYRCLKKKRHVISSPTSSGKSSIIAAITRYLQDYKLQDGEKILLLVPNVSLVNQFAYDLCDYFSKDMEWLQSDPVHTIFSGQDKDAESPIYISTYQSLMRLPKEFFKQFRAIMVDECHLSESKMITKIVDSCVNADYRFGFTGSLKDAKTHILTLEGMFGRTHTTITTKELMEQGSVTELEIKALMIKHPLEECEKHRKINDYASEIDYLVGDERRNRFICKLAASQKGSGLVLVNLIEKHAEPLLEMMKETVGDSRPVFYISGKVKGSEREEIRLSLEKNPNAIIVASYATLSTGVNIPTLQWLIFGSPTKSMVRTVQSIGRILRLHKSKNLVTLFDIIDDLRFTPRKTTRENYAWKHAVDRLSIYSDQKFDVEVRDMPIYGRNSGPN